MLDNVELIMYMKFQKVLMIGCRDMGKKHQIWVFFPFVTPQDFFSKMGLCHFYPLWWPNFMQKIRKNQWVVFKIFKDGRTDGRTDKGDYYRPHRVNPGSKIYDDYAFDCLYWSSLCNNVYVYGCQGPYVKIYLSITRTIGKKWEVLIS